MNASYKRYWQPSTVETVSASLVVGAVASFVAYPFEFIKTRIQLRSEGIGIRSRNLAAGYNPWNVFRGIQSSGVGLRGLYQGFDSFILGRLSYLFIRNLTYKLIYDSHKPVKAHNDLTTREKAVIAGFAGALAAFITTPFELVNVRQIAERHLPQNSRRGYTSFSDGYNKIISTEGGNAAVFRGGLANVIKAVLLNISLTGPYDYLNEKCYITFGDIQFNKWFSLLWATTISTYVVLPFDNVRTRLMNQFPDSKLNRITYHSYREVIIQSLAIEGWTSLWSGFTAAFLRNGVYAGLTVYTMDTITTAWKRKAGLKEWQI